MSTTGLDIERPAPASAPARTPWVQRLRSEPAVLAALALSLALYYLGPGLSFVLGAIAFFALTLYRPDLQLAMVPLAAPLFYRPRAIGPYFFSLAEFVIVCGVAAWALRDGSALARSRTRARALLALRDLARQPGAWLAGALVLVGLLWLLVPDPAHRKVAVYDFWRTVLSPALFFALVLRWLRTERDLWRMVGAWLVAAALVGREAVEQYLFGQTSFMEGVGRVVSIYPSATALGIYLGRALALGLVLAFFLPASWRAWKLAAAALSIVIGLGTLFSFARGAWLGVLAALLFVGLLTRSRPLLLALGAALLAALASLPFVRVERITSLFDFTRSENTGVARTQIWRAALRILRDHPLTGIGQDQFLYADPKYGVPQARLLVTAHPHDWVLDFWLRLGLPGLACIAAALTYFFWQSIHLWRRHRGTELGALALALLASMIDFAVHGLVDMAYFTMDLALTFWLTMGLLVVLKRLPQPAGRG